MSRQRIGARVEAFGLIALGGMMGSSLRYGLGAVSGEALLVTIAVNALGSFGIGLLLFYARADNILSKRLRLVFGTGFFASFTSYSTFVADLVTLDAQWMLVYIVGSYATAFGGVLLGRQVVVNGSERGIRTSPREND